MWTEVGSLLMLLLMKKIPLAPRLYSLLHFIRCIFEIPLGLYHECKRLTGAVFLSLPSAPFNTVPSVVVTPPTPPYINVFIATS